MQFDELFLIEKLLVDAFISVIFIVTFERFWAVIWTYLCYLDISYTGK